MKKFIIKITIISLTTLVLFSLLNVIFINSEYFRTAIINYSRFADIPNNIQIANTGSSHGSAGFEYSGFPEYTCQKLSISSQTFHYDLKMLQQFRDKFADGCHVIIPVSYLSFYKVNEDVQKKQGLRYYRILDPELIDDFNISDYIIYKLFPVLSADKELVTALKASFGMAPKKPESLDQYTPEQFAESQNYNRITYFNDYSYDPAQLEHLCELVEYALSENLKPVLVTVPVADVYASLVSEEIMNDFTDSVGYVIANYNVEHLDYGSHPDYESDYTLFRNSSHLNDEGANKFTNEIFTRLGLAD